MRHSVETLYPEGRYIVVIAAQTSNNTIIEPRFAHCAVAVIATVAAICLVCAFCLFPKIAHAAQGSSGQDFAAGTGTSLQSKEAQSEKSSVSTAANAKLKAGSEQRVVGVGVALRPYVQYDGWYDWVIDNQVAGTLTSKGLRAFQLKLTGLPKGLTGSINYQVYDMGKGWGNVITNGHGTGNANVPVKAVRIWLSGPVARHYDVLYRVRLAGSGWRMWAKNKAACGSSRDGVYATALQVKLSPKTEEALGRKSYRAGVRYEARIADFGWQSWTGDGLTAGHVAEAAAGLEMDGFALKLDTGLMRGNVQYRVYIQGKRWSQGWINSGQVAGMLGKRIEGIQCRLTGAIAKRYDIYYRSYIYGLGWLDWAKNRTVSGGAGNSLPIAGVQVKIVKKGTSAPGVTDAPTANLFIRTLNGIDISSWQKGIDIPRIDADFVIVKATGGKAYTNEYFKVMANAAIRSGKLLGFYHFARERKCPGTAEQEADYFISRVKPYIGRAVLVLDWEADALLLGPGWAKRFLDRVYARTGVRPLIYMSKNYTRTYDWTSVAKNYKLWVAQYSLKYQKGTDYVLNPWTDNLSFGSWEKPVIYQYTSAGRLANYNGNLDLNLFYGTAADWKALAIRTK